MRKLPPYDRNAPTSRWPESWPESKKPAPTALLTLTCGHSNEFDLPAPGPRGRAYCRRCRDYRRVSTNPTKD